jgi:hypothetical protein
MARGGRAKHVRTASNQSRQYAGTPVTSPLATHPGPGHWSLAISIKQTTSQTVNMALYDPKLFGYTQVASLGPFRAIKLAAETMVRSPLTTGRAEGQRSDKVAFARMLMWTAKTCCAVVSTWDVSRNLIFLLRTCHMARRTVLLREPIVKFWLII